MLDLGSKKAVTRIHNGIRWDIRFKDRNVEERVWLARSTIDKKHPGEWIPTHESVVEYLDGQLLLTTWTILSDFPARAIYYTTFREALAEAKAHVDLQV